MLTQTLSVAVRSLADAGVGFVLGVALRSRAVKSGLGSDGAPTVALEKVFGGDVLPIHFNLHR